MTFPELLDDLNARGVFRIRPGLGRIRKVLRALGNPQDRIRAIHIAGTNGKGSVAAALESSLRACGYSTGLYTSPHLIDLRERIRLSGREVRQELVSAATQVLHAERSTQVKLTYFEFLTATAFLVFTMAKVDIAIIECGLGGKWDATNTLKAPLLSIITSIQLDHTDYLGKTLSQIARQKAGIIKKGRPVISGVFQEGKRVIAAQSRAKKSKLIQLGVDFKFSSLPVSLSQSHQMISYHAKGKGTEYIPYGLLGIHQIHNGSLVAAALHELEDQGWKIPREARNNGLRHIVWPGRFQLLEIDKGPILLLDGAHNPQAMQSLLRSLKSSPLCRKLKTFVFSAYHDKDYANMAHQIAKVADEVCLCPLPSLRATPLKQLRAAFRNVKGPVREFVSFKDSLNAALRDTPSDGLIVITGSLALVGEALKLLDPVCFKRIQHV
jgi:dihydrofolate synthase / folylpolyglutamate synthase